MSNLVNPLLSDVFEQEADVLEELAAAECSIKKRKKLNQLRIRLANTKLAAAKAIRELPSG